MFKSALVAGCERAPFVFLFMGCGFMAAPMNIYGIILGIIIFAVGLILLRMMAKKDPIMTKVYLRHIKYKKFYPGKPSIHRFLK